MKTCSIGGVKTNWKQFVLAAVAFVVIAQVVNTIGAIWMMGYYTDPAYFPLWSRLMMPNNGPPGAAFYIASLFSNFATGLIFAGAYSLVASNMPGEGVTKGVNFGVFLFFVVGVSFTLSVKLLLAVPGAMLAGWVAESIVTYTIAGAAFSMIVVEQ